MSDDTLDKPRAEIEACGDPSICLLIADELPIPSRGHPPCHFGNPSLVPYSGW